MKTIVFIKFTPRIRTYKQALAVKKTGKYKTILVGINFNKKIFSNAFDTIIDLNPYLTPIFWYKYLSAKILKKLDSLCKKYPRLKFLEAIIEKGEKLCPNKFIKIIKKMNQKACLFHTIAEPNFLPALVMKNTTKPVIYDAYDFSGIRYGIDKLRPTEREEEKVCLENANGISMKFPQWVLDYYRNLGYKINCPVLNFIDYCLPDFFFYKNNKLKKENVHIVYAGGVNPSSAPSEYYGNNQYFDIIKKIIKQRIYFHLYIPPWQLKRHKSQYLDYYNLSEQNEYFILHSGMSQPELQKEISQYHFGCHINDFSKTKHTKLFEKTSFGNKFSTYLEAGLPIIVADNLKLNAEWVEKYKVGFKINLQNLKELSPKLKEINYNKLKENVRIVREGPLNIYNNIDKLANFYEKIISKNQSPNQTE